MKLHNPKSEIKVNQAQQENFPTSTPTFLQDDLICPTIEQTQPIENLTPIPNKKDGQEPPTTEQTQPLENAPMTPNPPMISNQQIIPDDLCPLGPFSQRTHRLLTSPINLNLLHNSIAPNHRHEPNFNKNLDSENTFLEENSIPEMETVLVNFGVNIHDKSDIDNIENTNNNITLSDDENHDKTVSETETYSEPSIS